MTALIHWLASSVSVSRWAVCLGAFCAFALVVEVLAFAGLYWLSSTWHAPENEEEIGK